MGRCADRTARTCIGLLALLFWAGAVAVLYAAGVLLKTFKNYEPFFHGVNILLPCDVAVAGAVFLVINGLLGFCISNKGSRCKQGTFMYFIVVLICLEATAAILAFVYVNRIDYELNPMTEAFSQYNGSDSDRTVNKIQAQLKCCGLNNYTYWETNSWYIQYGNFSVPKSCCDKVFPLCTGNISASNEIYHEGCYEKLHDKISFHMTLLFWSCIGVLCSEVLAAINDGVLMTRNPFQDFRILDSATFT
ncbi:tetraspanin-3-like [Discoglossus pictus]